ncbi:MAG: DUF6438 domain-containing protein [Holophagales bacterium]|nr:DUF6438 domain-containing protein [Holophagales bacterium]
MYKLLCRHFCMSALLVTVLIGCSIGKPVSPEPIRAAPGPLDAIHTEKHPWGATGTVFDKARRERAMKGSAITRIGLEETSCYGLCPEYTVLYCRAGKAFYCGRANVEPLGCHEAEIEEELFMMLAGAMEEIGFFEMEHTYAAMVTDNPSVLVLGDMDGEEKVVRDYAESGPYRLWLLEYLLGDLVDRIDWRPMDARDTALTCPDPGKESKGRPVDAGG